MAGLVLNGIELPVALGSAQRRIVVVGDRFRAFDGTPRKTERVRKSEWAGKLSVVEQANALAWRGLINGEGDHWSFDTDLFSDKGLGPVVSTGATVPAGGKYGNKLTLAATTGIIQWPIPHVSTWTVFVWRYESGAWKHYVARSDGAQWINGVNTPGAPAWLLVAFWAGLLQIANAGGSAQDYDDLVYLPYVTPDDWSASVYTEMNARAWSPMPRLRASGDLVPNAPVTIEGAAGDTDLVPHMAASVWTLAGEEPDFSLQEV